MLVFPRKSWTAITIQHVVKCIDKIIFSLLPKSFEKSVKNAWYGRSDTPFSELSLKSQDYLMNLARHMNFKYCMQHIPYAPPVKALIVWKHLEQGIVDSDPLYTFYKKAKAAAIAACYSHWKYLSEYDPGYFRFSRDKESYFDFIEIDRNEIEHQCYCCEYSKQLAYTRLHFLEEICNICPLTSYAWKQGCEHEGSSYMIWFKVTSPKNERRAAARIARAAQKAYFDLTGEQLF